MILPRPSSRLKPPGSNKSGGGSRWPWKALIWLVALLILAIIAINMVVKHYTQGYAYNWHQRINVVIDTPQGPVTASSVQAMEVRYFPDGLFLSGVERNYDLTGEAAVADLGDGRYLFALIGNNNMAERTYRDLKGDGSTGDLLKRIRRQKGKPAREMRRRDWPQLVTFADVNDPATVMAVDPDDLAATFGAGYALNRMTIEITWGPETEGRVESLELLKHFENHTTLSGLKRFDPARPGPENYLTKRSFVRGTMQ